MKNIIITSADLKYGDFIINHWLRSLKDNVNLKNIEVAVVDYGLNSSQKDKLKKENVIIIQGSKNGNIGNLRFIDALKFLQKNAYNQVLSVDGGDIIFQDDISFLFDKDKNYFRVVGHDLENLFLEVFIRKNFSKEIEEKIWQFLKNKPMSEIVGAGVIFAPYNKFIYLCKQIDKLVLNKNSYGPDQIVANYITHQEGIKFLDKKYNFMPSGFKDKFIVEDGIFYMEDGKKIAIFHNSGNLNWRVVKNFGYGNGFNTQINYPLYYGKKFLYSYITPIIKKIILAIN